jgi:hypothetical protein
MPALVPIGCEGNLPHLVLNVAPVTPGSVITIGKKSGMLCCETLKRKKQIVETDRGHGMPRPSASTGHSTEARYAMRFNLNHLLRHFPAGTTSKTNR